MTEAVEGTEEPTKTASLERNGSDPPPESTGNGTPASSSSSSSSSPEQKSRSGRTSTKDGRRRKSRSSRRVVAAEEADAVTDSKSASDGPTRSKKSKKKQRSSSGDNADSLAVDRPSSSRSLGRSKRSSSSKTSGKSKTRSKTSSSSSPSSASSPSASSSSRHSESPQQAQSETESDNRQKQHPQHRLPTTREQSFSSRQPLATVDEQTESRSGTDAHSHDDTEDHQPIVHEREVKSMRQLATNSRQLLQPDPSNDSADSVAPVVTDVGTSNNPPSGDSPRHTDPSRHTTTRTTIRRPVSFRLPLRGPSADLDENDESAKDNNQLSGQTRSKNRSTSQRKLIGRSSSLGRLLSSTSGHKKKHKHNTDNTRTNNKNKKPSISQSFRIFLKATKESHDDSTNSNRVDSNPQDNRVDSTAPLPTQQRELPDHPNKTQTLSSPTRSDSKTPKRSIGRSVSPNKSRSFKAPLRSLSDRVARVVARTTGKTESPNQAAAIREHDEPVSQLQRQQQQQNNTDAKKSTAGLTRRLGKGVKRVSRSFRSRSRSRSRRSINSASNHDRDDDDRHDDAAEPSTKKSVRFLHDEITAGRVIDPGMEGQISSDENKTHSPQDVHRTVQQTSTIPDPEHNRSDTTATYQREALDMVESESIHSNNVASSGEGVDAITQSKMSKKKTRTKKSKKKLKKSSALSKKKDTSKQSVGQTTTEKIPPAPKQGENDYEVPLKDITSKRSSRKKKTKRGKKSSLPSKTATTAVSAAASSDPEGIRAAALMRRLKREKEKQQRVTEAEHPSPPSSNDEQQSSQSVMHQQAMSEIADSSIVDGPSMSSPTCITLENDGADSALVNGTPALHDFPGNDTKNDDDDTSEAGEASEDDEHSDEAEDMENSESVLLIQAPDLVADTTQVDGSNGEDSIHSSLDDRQRVQSEESILPRHHHDDKSVDSDNFNVAGSDGIKGRAMDSSGIKAEGYLYTQPPWNDDSVITPQTANGDAFRGELRQQRQPRQSNHDNDGYAPYTAYEAEVSDLEDEESAYAYDDEHLPSDDSSSATASCDESRGAFNRMDAGWMPDHDDPWESSENAASLIDDNTEDDSDYIEEEVIDDDEISSSDEDDTSYDEFYEDESTISGVEFAEEEFDFEEVQNTDPTCQSLAPGQYKDSFQAPACGLSGAPALEKDNLEIDRCQSSRSCVEVSDRVGDHIVRSYQQYQRVDGMDPPETKNAAEGQHDDDDDDNDDDDGYDNNIDNGGSSTASELRRMYSSSDILDQPNILSGDGSVTDSRTDSDIYNSEHQGQQSIRGTGTDSSTAREGSVHSSEMDDGAYLLNSHHLISPSQYHDDTLESVSTSESSYYNHGDNCQGHSSQLAERRTSFPPAEIITSDSEDNWWDVDAVTDHAVRVVAGPNVDDFDSDTDNSDRSDRMDPPSAGGTGEDRDAVYSCVSGNGRRSGMIEEQHDLDHASTPIANGDIWNEQFANNANNVSRDEHNEDATDATDATGGVEDSVEDSDSDDISRSSRSDNLDTKQSNCERKQEQIYVADDENGSDDDGDIYNPIRREDPPEQCVVYPPTMAFAKGTADSSQRAVDFALQLDKHGKSGQDQLYRLFPKSPTNSDTHSMSLSTDNEITEHSATFRSLFRSERTRGSMYLSPETADNGSSRHNLLNERIAVEWIRANVAPPVDVQESIGTALAPAMTAIEEAGTETAPDTPISEPERGIQPVDSHNQAERFRPSGNAGGAEPEEQKPRVSDRGDNNKSKHISELFLKEDNDDSHDDCIGYPCDIGAATSETSSEGERSAHASVDKGTCTRSMPQPHPDGDPLPQPSPSRITNTERLRGINKVLHIIKQTIDEAEQEHERWRLESQTGLDRDAEGGYDTASAVLNARSDGSVNSGQIRPATSSETGAARNPDGSCTEECFNDSGNDDGGPSAESSRKSIGENNQNDDDDDDDDESDLGSLEDEKRFTEAMKDYLEKISKEPVGVVKTPTGGDGKKKRALRSNFGMLRKEYDSDYSSSSSSAKYSDDDIIPPRLMMRSPSESLDEAPGLDLDEEEFTEVVRSYLDMNYRPSDSEKSSGSDTDDGESDQKHKRVSLSQRSLSRRGTKDAGEDAGSKTSSAKRSKKKKKKKSSRRRSSSVPASKSKRRAKPGKMNDTSDDDTIQDEAAARKPKSFSHRSTKKSGSGGDKKRSNSRRRKRKDSSDIAATVTDDRTEKDGGDPKRTGHSLSQSRGRKRDNAGSAEAEASNGDVVGEQRPSNDGKKKHRRSSSEGRKRSSSNTSSRKSRRNIKVDQSARSNAIGVEATDDNHEQRRLERRHSFSGRPGRRNDMVDGDGDGTTTTTTKKKKVADKSEVLDKESVGEDVGDKNDSVPSKPESFLIQTKSNSNHSKSSKSSKSSSTRKKHKKKGRDGQKAVLKRGKRDGVVAPMSTSQLRDLLDLEEPKPKSKSNSDLSSWQARKPASFRLSSRPDLPLDFASALPNLQM